MLVCDTLRCCFVCAWVCEQLHKKLDEPDLEQEVRVECLRELEQCTSQLAVLEEQIVDLWTNHAAELCLSTVQQKQRLHQQQQEQQKQD